MFIKFIGVFLYNNTTVNQLHIDGQSQINYMWSLQNFKVSEILCVITFYIICNPSFC